MWRAINGWVAQARWWLTEIGVIRRPAASPHSEAGPLARWSQSSRAYFQKWLVIGALVGVVAGLGSIAFFAAIAFCSRIFLGLGAGFTPPNPAGEGPTVITSIARPWMIPVVTTIGGLLAGLIVFTFAPEAEGHGTDAAIDAFHRRGGKIRARIPGIKLVASAITIGSGGSAGREGPTAQIAAGFGSWLGDILHLDDHDRRIAMAAGVGAGIGSIFKAPFGGALLSAEILYKRDFEAEALFPAFIASVVGFSIYGAWAGWTPVFGGGGTFSFNNPQSLIGFLLLGIICGVVGMLYPKMLYGIRDIFHGIHIPNQLKPAIGGLFVGLIGMAFPQALGMGYGYVQFGIYGNFVTISAWMMLLLAFIKIVTTSLTIGSGGSGGVFGPGMVIGGFLGGAFWAGLHSFVPWALGSTPAGAFVVVGMGAFFGGIAKAPLAVILMVAEMTGEYSLIVPAMLATMVAYLITGETSIYESQVDTRLDSPSHKGDYALPLLQSLTVRQAMTPGRATAGPDSSVAELSSVLREQAVASVPIVEDGRLIGLVTTTDIARVPPQRAQVTRARQIMSRQVVRAYADESLYDAWLRMTQRGLRQLAVVDRMDAHRMLGMVTLKAIGQLLRQPITASLSALELAAPSTPAPTGAGRSVIAGSDHHDGDQRHGLPPGGARLAQAHGPGEEEAVAPDQETIQAYPHAYPHAYPQTTIEAVDADLERREEEEERSAPASLRRVQPPGSNPLEEEVWRRAAQSRAEQDPLAAISVTAAMLRTPRVIPETEPLAGVLARLDEHGRALMVVNAAGDLVGIVTRADLRGRSPVEDGKALTAGDVAVRRLVTAQPEETLRVAARRMSQLGLRQLPVVPKDTQRPVGLLRRSDILEAYTCALSDEHTGPQPTL